MGRLWGAGCAPDLRGSSRTSCKPEREKASSENPGGLLFIARGTSALKRSTLFRLACEALGLQALVVVTEGILGFPPLCHRPLCFATALFHPFLPLHARGGWLTVNHPISTHWGNNCYSMRLSRAFPWIARA